MLVDGALCHRTMGPMGPLANFLVSGRKIPRDGGIIVAVGSDRREIDAIMADDPFVSRGLSRGLSGAESSE